ncbi:MAG: transcription-repair coupling factor [Planctomycetaceae bacterium]|jgi:transcription-repair coupling factor (superfamily II helicase)|nr:transcription-repair coupling factor [Planctomycetaceae bacterium]
MISDYSEIMQRILTHPTATLSNLAAGQEAVHCTLPVNSIERVKFDGIDPDAVSYVFYSDDSEIEKLKERFGSNTPLPEEHWIKGHIAEGFSLSNKNQKIYFLSASELLHRGNAHRPKKRLLSQVIDSFTDLIPGDFVVHTAHGIARFRGIETLTKGQQEEEHLHLEFADSRVLYVPISKIGFVQKYVAGNRCRPKLAKIGGQLWLRQKKSVQAAVFDLAEEMIHLQARREAQPGTAFPPDSEWQKEFEAAFPFQETNDQLLAIEAVKQDMEMPRPMDRLICGDVGFGKTEVAIRAAFKAVYSGYQAAVLVPTTILADQHCRTFSERMRNFPITVAAMSRFQTKQEQKQIVDDLASGKVDILIGTHRIVSRDIQFRHLGLVVIDEEQRFGVAHKEKLKLLRDSVDVLTMTATPIPRTLHFSLLGIREISNLEMPPENRLAVKTKVFRWNDDVIHDAVTREINRGGQIYFVHNRVYDIKETAQRLQRIVPECRIGIGHAQMSDIELENVMRDFINHQFDMLVSTTIVESGLDIPNANTMFIDEADRYGLADLHQLRGRVGRADVQAYCYMLLAQSQSINSTAMKRLRAIEEYAHLGSGFHLAMRDLEIRGTGNILGTQQSGHIAAVGYEMYCQFLEIAVRTLKQLPPKAVIEVEIDLPGAALIPMDYVADQRVKIDFYRRLMRTATLEECDDLRSEMADRFGTLPHEVERLWEHSRIRVSARSYRIRTIKLESGLGNDSGYVVLEYVSQKLIDQLHQTLRHKGLELRITADRKAYVPMPKNLSRKAEADKILHFVLQILGADV